MDNLISRQALKNSLTNWQMEYADKSKDVERFETLGAVIELVEELPNIDPVKRGKWKCFIETGSGLYDSIDIPRAECSECGFKVPEEWCGWFKFCPNCGARMDGDE